MQFETGYEITKEGLEVDKDGSIEEGARLEARKRIGLAIVKRLEELDLLEIKPYSGGELKERNLAKGYTLSTEFDISWNGDCEREDKNAVKN